MSFPNRLNTFGDIRRGIILSPKIMLLFDFICSPEHLPLPPTSLFSQAGVKLGELEEKEKGKKKGRERVEELYKEHFE